ncbi:precorrin-6Y C5,15-methyltransferase (decarboxylating) [Hahella chejuensis KCTC 2396]|uniref:Precorrin-6Y C5,15-methyltransferase (Decarboxylating) n=1 Tax=Hahella chejuensis (strain KCTC 2396) TaxID=349521 RepID=Q2S8A8_HAHCH|nr:bifunctional cobalt-precorrin-7 (C(5))-methyltransferase/cobalt-precorrin-6B (C(15))-methyltransferase [Hahella chejuensis]ABC33116.1 precorrin-6Y C5,15-methyltransferase (decarboxylating) [Hahella chejuensis KCTC 2396]
MTQPVANPPLVHVVSLGVGERALLRAEAQEALRRADLIIGSERQLQTVASYPSQARTEPLPSPFSDLLELLRDDSGQEIALLASGDALFFGVGNWLNRHLPASQLRFYPQISSVQAACHEVGLDEHDMQTISLHGRPFASLRAQLRNRRSYALLTDQHSSPYAIASALQAWGMADSTLWVCEQLGYPEQRLRKFSVAELLANPPDVHALHVTLLQTAGPGGVLPEFPGIADQDFHTDGEPGKGMLSKREVRLCILSLLQPCADDIGWDVGAGCGGVAVEWARWNPRGQVYAIERHEERLRQLHRNREHFGVVRNLHIAAGRAPGALTDLPRPSVVFIGGSDGEMDTLLRYCWEQLPPGGRLVASAVTEDSKNRLLQFQTRLQDGDAEWTQVAVSRGETLAGQLLMRPQLPVTLVKFSKRTSFS